MLTRLVPVSAREKVYGINFMMLNAGLGLGGADQRRSSSTWSPSAASSGSTSSTALTYLVLPRRGPQPAPRHRQRRRARQDEPGRHRVASRRSAGAWCSATAPCCGWSAISVIAVTFGYAQMEAGLAAYAVDVAEVPPKALGFAYGANTAAIVFGQLLTLRLIKGRRRTSMLALCAATWSVSWVIIALSDRVDGWVAVAAIVVGLGLFGLGETHLGAGGPGDRQRPGAARRCAVATTRCRA